jgi:hypothetical protein
MPRSTGRNPARLYARRLRDLFNTPPGTGRAPSLTVGGTRAVARAAAPGHCGMDAAATCEWYMHKARKRPRAKPASVTREETKLQECEAVLAQVLGVPVDTLSRLELCNSGQEAELRRRAHDDPDVVVPLTLAFRHAVDARKHRDWWSGEVAAAGGVHEWFRPEPQLVWRLKLMRALCGPLSHAACAQAAAAAELPAMLLEVSPLQPPPQHLYTNPNFSNHTSTPLPAPVSAPVSAPLPPPQPPSLPAGAAGWQRSDARREMGRRGWARCPLPRLPLRARRRPRAARRLRTARVLRAAQARRPMRWLRAACATAQS